MRWVRIASIALIGLCAPATAQVPSPAAGPAVALAPLVVPEGLENPDPVRAAFESIAARRLEAAGFVVVSPAVTGEIREAQRRANGPFFDPITGEELHERTKAARRAALRELAEKHSAVAWIRLSIEVAPVQYERGKASWDGAEESAAPTGSGEVLGATLVARLEDLAGEGVGVGRGGLQLVAKYSLWSSKFGSVPRKKLFRSEQTNAAAVQRALDPLIAALSEGRGQRTPPAESGPPPAIVEPIAVEPAWPELPSGARVALLRDLRAATGDVAVPDATRRRYLDLLTARLRSGGWTVVEPAVFEAAFRRAAIEAGGIYDPWTGEPDSSRFESVRNASLRHAAEHLPGAIVVRPVIAVVLAGFFNEKATWHGVSEPIAEIFFLRKLFGYTTGRTDALSFAVFVEDLEGKELHRGFGGIQLVAKLEHDRFVPVPPEQLFRDPALDERAVDLALGGFLAPRP